MTYLPLDALRAYGLSPRRVALRRHPVAAIHAMPCAVRCVNARNQRHKIQSPTRQARSSLRTAWRGALHLLAPRFIQRELPCCVASRVKRWRQHRRDRATEVSRGPRITHKTGETPTEVSFTLAIPTRVLREDPRDTSLHVKYASMKSWKRSTKATHTCSLHLLMQMRTSSHTKQEQWNAPARRQRTPLHKCVSSSRWKSLLRFDKFGKTRSTNRKGTANKRRVSPRSFLSRRPWCKFKRFTRAALSCMCQHPS